MASRAITQGRASALPTPADALEQLRITLSRLNYAALVTIAGMAIDALDERDGDPDREQTGDEGEPDFRKRTKRERRQHADWFGPGCVISDPDEGADDKGEVEPLGGGQILPTTPRYGLDQSLGPINEAEAVRSYHRSMLGLEQ